MTAQVEQRHVKRLFSSRWMCLRILLLLVFSSIAASRSIIKTLPGFTGDLPFKLETGYVGVGDTEDVQLFYYFVESQRSPAEDPLLLQLTGGPGCSGLSPFFYECGPLSFDYVDYNGSLPTLYLNPYTLTKGLNIIYLDSPVGTGFSYSTSMQGYYSDDRKSSSDIYSFLQKWLKDHPDFIKNQLYIGGESYSSIPAPIIVQKILDGNEAGYNPPMNLKGYVLASPKTDSYIDENSKVPFAHRLTLISDKLYEMAKRSCNGDYVNIDPSNEQCVADIKAIDELLRKINIQQVLEPVCTNGSPKQNDINWDRRSLEENSRDFLLPQLKGPAFWCRDYYYALSKIWANDKSIREALHVREGTKGYWEICNSSLAYTKDVLSTIDYHRNLSKTGLRALIFCGDHDLNIPHIGTQEWISSLNMTLDDVWRAWFVDGQVAGYTERYKNNNFYMTYATIKGAGHVATHFKPKESYAMLDRWFAYYPL